MQWRSSQWIGLAAAALIGVLAASRRSVTLAQEENLGAIVRDLCDGDKSQRIAAAKKLGDLHPVPGAVVPLLAGQLGIESWRRDEARDSVLVAALAQMAPAAKAAVPRLVAWYYAVGKNTGRPALDAVRAICPDHAQLIEPIERGKITGKAALLLLGEWEPETRGTVALLIEGVRHPSAEVRRAACRALYRHVNWRPNIEKNPVIGPLVECLRDDDPQVRSSAASALGVMEVYVEKPEAGRFDNALYRRGGRRVPVEAVAAMVEALADKELRVRVTAAHALRQNGAETGVAAVPALIEGLKSDERPLRRLAVEALSKIGPLALDALPALRDELMLERPDSEDTWVRADVARAISQIAPAEDGIPILLTAWKETKMYPATLVETVGSYSTAHPQVVPFLIEATRIDHPNAKYPRNVWVVAVRALGYARPVTREAVSCVIEHAKGPDLDLRSVAVMALEEIGKVDDRVVPALLDVAQLPDRDGQHRCKALDAIRRLGPDGTTIEGLTRLLRAPSAIVREKSAETLGSFGPAAKRALPTLIRLLGDRNRDVQAAAVAALGRLGPAARPAIPQLIARMERHRGYWGDSPAEALGRIGPDAVPLLVQSMQRPRKERVEFGAADVLEELGPRAEAAVPELIEMLDAKDSTIRLEAVFVLKAIGPNAAAAVPALAAMRKDKALGLYYARDALVHIGKPAVPTLVADLPDTIGLLGSMGPKAKGAIPALEALLDKKHEDSIRFAATEAFAAIGGDADVILPMMRAMLQSGQPEVRVQAMKAMRHTALEDRTNWVVEALRKSLNDPDREVRFAAAWALLINFRATAKETLPVLGEMLVYDGTTGIVNSEAAKALIMLLGRAEDGEQWTNPQYVENLLF